MEWKKETLQSILKPNKEKLIFLFCSGLLLFVLALPSEGDGLVSNASETLLEDSRISGDRDVLKADSFEEELEIRVRNILSGVEGVGEVEVMVSLRTDDEVGMFGEEHSQEVLGIIVSADGGGSAVVKAEISEAMEALFGLPPHKIKVLKRVKKGV